MGSTAGPLLTGNAALAAASISSISSLMICGFIFHARTSVRRQGEEGEFRQPRNQAESEERTTCDPEQARTVQQLLAHVDAEDSFEAARVTTMPPATDTSSEGRIVTRPSPTVRMV